MGIINVVEIVDNNALSITSFVVEEETKEKEQVEKAESLYRSKAIENGAPKDIDEFDEEIGYDNFSSNNYSVSIVWSDIVK